MYEVSPEATILEDVPMPPLNPQQTIPEPAPIAPSLTFSVVALLIACLACSGVTGSCEWSLYNYHYILLQLCLQYLWCHQSLHYFLISNAKHLGLQQLHQTYL